MKKWLVLGQTLVLMSAVLAFVTCENDTTSAEPVLLPPDGGAFFTAVQPLTAGTADVEPGAVVGVFTEGFTYNMVDGSAYIPEGAAIRIDRDNGLFVVDGTELKVGETPLEGGRAYYIFIQAGRSGKTFSVTGNLFVTQAGELSGFDFEWEQDLAITAVKGDPAGIFTNTDNDNGPYSYILAAGNGVVDADNDSFEIIDDNLYVKKEFAEARDYKIYVRISDNEQRVYEKNFMVPVKEETSYDVTPNGIDHSGSTTTLTLSFSVKINTLENENITLTDNSGNAVSATLMKGEGNTWVLPVTVSKAGLVNVSIDRKGIESGEKIVPVYKQNEYAFVLGGAVSLSNTNPVNPESMLPNVYVTGITGLDWLNTISYRYEWFKTKTPGTQGSWTSVGAAAENPDHTTQSGDGGYYFRCRVTIIGTNGYLETDHVYCMGQAYEGEGFDLSGTLVPLSVSIFGDSAVNGVAWGNGVYVAVGAGGKIATSYNGYDWALVNTSVFGGTDILAVAYGDAVENTMDTTPTPTFYAGGKNGKLAWSEDNGATWTALTADTSGFADDTEIISIAWSSNSNAKRFTAVSQSPEQVSCAFSKEAWKTVKINNLTSGGATPYDVSGSAGGFFIASSNGTNGKISFNAAGASYAQGNMVHQTITNAGIIRTITCNGVFPINSGTILVFGTEDGKIYKASGFTAFTGVSASSSIVTQEAFSSGDVIRDSVFQNGICVLAGDDGKICYSTDNGTTWNAGKLSTNKTINAVAADILGGFVLVGENGTIAYCNLKN